MRPTNPASRPRNRSQFRRVVAVTCLAVAVSIVAGLTGASAGWPDFSRPKARYRRAPTRRYVGRGTRLRCPVAGPICDR